MKPQAKRIWYICRIQYIGCDNLLVLLYLKLSWSKNKCNIQQSESWCLTQIPLNLCLMQKIQIFKNPKYHKEMNVGKKSTGKLKTTFGLRNLFCFPPPHLKKSSTVCYKNYLCPQHCWNHDWLVIQQYGKDLNVYLEQRGNESDNTLNSISLEAGRIYLLWMALQIAELFFQ